MTFSSFSGKTLLNATLITIRHIQTASFIITVHKIRSELVTGGSQFCPY